MEEQFSTALDGFSEDVSIPINRWTDDTYRNLLLVGSIAGLTLAASQSRMRQPLPKPSNKLSSQRVRGSALTGSPLTPAFGLAGFIAKKLLSTNQPTAQGHRLETTQSSKQRAQIYLRKLSSLSTISGITQSESLSLALSQEAEAGGIKPPALRGELLFQESGLPDDVAQELADVAKFEKMAGQSRHVHRTIIAYVEAIARLFLVIKLPKQVQETVLSQAKSASNLETIISDPTKASLGKIAMWCREVERAIKAENETVCVFYSGRFGSLDSFINHSFSALLSALAPIRNDLMHGRIEQQRPPEKIIQLSFGTQYFYEWWENSHPPTTPFTKLLYEYVILKKFSSN